MRISARRGSGVGRNLLAGLLLLLLAGAGRAEDAYFVLVFGSQQTPNNPDYSHSFATFVKATGVGPCAGKPALEKAAVLDFQTISWLPENMIVRTRALRPECGHNFELHETICYALKNDERVSMWGPYLVEPDLYCRAVKQIRLLESGEVRYKAFDVGYRSDEVSNCIHAVSSIVDGYRLRVGSPGWGEVASYYIKERMRPWIADQEETHDWVVYALGLEAYPIIYRDRRNPRSSRFSVSRILGGQRNLQSTYGPSR
ncbi:MAG: hypothetical protein ACJ8FY_01035 [Gemmataceae bacterium]